METKEIKPMFTDRASLACTAEEIKEKLDGIELLFYNCNNKLAEMEMSACDYGFQADAITTMTNNMQKLYLYAKRAHEQVSEVLDNPLYLHFKKNATETTTSIMLNEITTDNTFQMEEHFEVRSQEGEYYISKRVKDTLTMEDFLGLQEITPQSGMPILENIETVGEFAALFRQDFAILSAHGIDIKSCLETYINTGDAEHKGYHPLADMLSGIADIFVIIPMIECITGKDLITQEHLTETELDWKRIGIIIDLITLGQGGLALSGAKTFKEVLKLAGKTMVVDALSATAAYGTAYIGTELGLSEESILLLSLIAGGTVSAASGKALLKNIEGGTSSKIGYEYLDEQLGNLKDKVKINQYQSAESVNAWWEARGYKSPYKEKTVVQNITLTEDTKFVRVYDGVNSNLEGGWVMRAEDIKGLTPKEIQAKFALEYEPKFIGEVELKAGDTVRLGEVGPNFGFDGGGIQIDLQQQWIGDFTELGKIEDWR